MNHTIIAIAALLNSAPTIRFATVFGSVAEGRAGSESDVDVAIAANAPLSREEKISLVERIATTAGPILQQALTRGRIVKCEDRALYARLILKMLYNQADEMPYRRRILEQRQRTWTQR
jgi:predicted nucleotidyltransferase